MPSPLSLNNRNSPHAFRRLVQALILLALAVWVAAPALANHPTAGAGCGPERALSLQSPVLTGADVQELQERLKTLGHGPGAVDGVYGPQTADSVREFQRANDLRPDGVVGLKTWSALGPEPLAVAATGQDAPQGELMIVVDSQNLKLTLYADGKPFKTYPVAVGRPKQLTLTPVGEWKVVHKSRNWGGGFGTRWLGINVPWGIYGIHGTNKPWSIGSRASAGCIRMFNRHVEELYSWVPAGTKVKIIGVEPDVSFRRTLRSGMTDRSVVFVQLRLQELGFEAEGADGRFGPNTAAAAKELQNLYGLPVDGEVYEDLFYILGLK